MKDNITLLFIILFLSIGYPTSSYSDIITKDGVKIKFFRKGEKKSISKIELSNPEGITSEDNLLEKIVFSEGNENLGSITYTVKVINKSNNDLLLKKEFIDTYYQMKNYFSIPVYPWIDNKSTFQGDNPSSEMYILGEYSIIIERVENNKTDILFTLPYQVIDNVY